MRRAAWAIIGLLLLVAAAAASFQAIENRADAHRTPEIGRLVDVGGFRLKLNCSGEGNPAVILEGGLGDPSVDWRQVQPEIAKFSRVCSYDRAGYGGSDAGPMPRSSAQIAAELHTLLENAGEKPPYILVGHSIGGIIARFFERKYPDETKGLVLVDATSEDTKLFINGKIQRLRLLSQGRAIPPVKKRPDTLTKIPSGKELEEIQKMVGQPKTESPFDKLPIEQ